MRRVRLPSPATLIALLALFVALGGPAQAARLIGGKQIKRNAITSKHVKNRSLGLTDLKRQAVAALAATPPNSVRSDQIADGAIAAADLAGASVNSSHVADRTLVGTDIARNAISGDEIGVSAVGGDEIAPNAVSGDEIARDAVTGDEVAAGAITADELDDGRLGARDVASFAGAVNLDFPAVGPGACSALDADVTAVATTTPAQAVTDDLLVVTPPPSFPDNNLTLSASPVGATKIRVRICNFNGSGAIDIPSLSYRYMSFDF